MEKYTVLLDMDNIIVDFEKGALAAHGVAQADYDAKRKLDEWSMLGPLSMTEDEFWREINLAGSDFWVGLEELPWVDELIGMLEIRGLHDWYIVTAPSYDPSSYYGKAMWLKRRFGADFKDIVMTAHKHLLARPSTILIDDREENIDKFIEAGGLGIVFPCLGNSLYLKARWPLLHVEQELRKILCT